jgi:phosphatidylethanolamine-binding protein (PEBP) family uncharacterized protein
MHSRLQSPALGSVLAVMLALTACGGSSSTAQSPSTSATSATQASASTPASTSTTASTSTSATTTASKASSEKVPTLDIQMASSVKLEPIAARYTCDGANISPPISWSHIPPHTVELDLFLFNLQPVHGKLFASWGVAGLSPKLHSLRAGQLPPGAIVGRNSHGQTGYSFCPPKGPSVRSLFLLYALPKKIPARPGFKAEALREKALHEAKSLGLLGVTYKRR